MAPELTKEEILHAAQQAERENPQTFAMLDRMYDAAIQQWIGSEAEAVAVREKLHAYVLAIHQLKENMSTLAQNVEIERQIEAQKEAE